MKAVRFVNSIREKESSKELLFDIQTREKEALKAVRFVNPIREKESSKELLFDIQTREKEALRERPSKSKE